MEELFSAGLGVGVIVCFWTVLMLAARRDAPPGRSLGDAYDVRAHRRGFLQVGLGLMAFGALGHIALALF